MPTKTVYPLYQIKGYTEALSLFGQAELDALPVFTNGRYARRPTGYLVIFKDRGEVIGSQLRAAPRTKAEGSLGAVLAARGRWPGIFASQLLPRPSSAPEGTL